MSSNNEEQMSPSASPGQQSKRSGVRRVNNVPVYIVVGGLAVFLLIMVLVASDRAAKQNQPGTPADPGKGGNTNVFAKEIAGDRKDGMIPAKLPTPPVVPDLAAPADSIAIARPVNLDLPPSPPTSQQQGPQTHSAGEDEADRLRIMKLQQFDEAVKSKTSITMSAARSAGSSLATTSLAGQGAPTSRDEAFARLAAV